MSANFGSQPEDFYYFYSAFAQVVATLIGLVLAGFTLYHNHLRSLVDKDETYDEVVNLLLKIQTRRLNYFMTVALGTLVFSLGILRNGVDFAVEIFYFSNRLNLLKFYEVLILCWLCYLLFRLIYTMLNPDAISEQFKNMSKELYSVKSNVSVEEFMTLYIKLESAIGDYFLQIFPNFTSINFSSTSRKLEKLRNVDFVIERLFNRLKVLIKVRNLLINGVIKEVPLDSYNDLEDVLSELKIDINTDVNLAEQSSPESSAL